MLPQAERGAEATDFLTSSCAVEREDRCIWLFLSAEGPGSEGSLRFVGPSCVPPPELRAGVPLLDLAERS